MSDVENNQEMSFAELFAQSEMENPSKISIGETLAGTIVSITKEYAFIDYGGKGEASLAAEELFDENGEALYKSGDPIEATVIAFRSGTPIVSRTLRASLQHRELLESAFASGLPVEGRVTGLNKGGYEVEVAGLRGFCPVSQIDIHYVEEPKVYLNETLSFLIIEYAEGGKQLVLSRREILMEEQAKKAEELHARLVEGDDYEGVITNIRPFGAFVDLGGLEGLVHISEISHARVEDPQEVLRQGQKVRVRLLGITNDKEGRERLSLSLKALEESPWTVIRREMKEGQIRSGQVTRLAAFGAFVQLLPGVEGLVHVSELSDKHVSHPREVVNEGETVEVKVLKIDYESERISLSRREAIGVRTDEQGNILASEGRGAEIPEEGSVVKGRVLKVKPFGVLVRLEPRWKSLVGLLPLEESGVSGAGELMRRFPPDSELKVVVLSLDRETNRMRLSIKALDELEARGEYQKYQKESTVKAPGSFGTLGDLLKKKT